MPTNSTAPRKLRQKSDKYHNKITKRGVASAPKKTGDESPIGPVLLALFIFIIVGSALLQIFRAMI